MPDLPLPPRRLLDRASLFLDFDGTLAEFVDPARDPAFPAARRDIIVEVGKRLGGRLAIISGRSLDSLERLIGIDHLDLYGSHGLERRSAGGQRTHAEVPDAIDEVHADAVAFAQPRHLVVETKNGGATIHYRGRPEVEPEVSQFAERLARDHGLELRRGSMIAEVRAPGPDKGDALALLMAEKPFSGGVPIFVGDDITDEDGFAAAVALGGAGVLVGGRNDSCASYRLPDVAAVFDWLEAV